MDISYNCDDAAAVRREAFVPALTAPRVLVSEELATRNPGLSSAA